MTDSKKERQIPLTVGIACVIYAFFCIAAFLFFGISRASLTSETIAVSMTFFVLPILALVGLLMRKQFGWYLGMLLPMGYLLIALVLWALAAVGITYPRWNADMSHEYTFNGQAGMHFLATLTLSAAVILIPALLLLLTATARATYQPAKRGTAAL